MPAVGGDISTALLTQMVRMHPGRVGCRREGPLDAQAGRVRRRSSSAWPTAWCALPSVVCSCRWRSRHRTCGRRRSISTPTRRRPVLLALKLFPDKAELFKTQEGPRARRGGADRTVVRAAACSPRTTLPPMAHLNVSLDFDSESETTSGNGWRVIHWLDDGSGTPTSRSCTPNLYATITAGAGRHRGAVLLRPGGRRVLRCQGRRRSRHLVIGPALATSKSACVSPTGSTPTSP